MIEFGLDGEPDVLIATCLSGDSAGPTIGQMLAAVRLTLDEWHWQAGPHRVGHLTLGAHAHEIADHPRVLGVLAPFRSAETSHLLADLNRAGLAVVSASNTYVPL